MTRLRPPFGNFAPVYARGGYAARSWGGRAPDPGSEIGSRLTLSLPDESEASIAKLVASRAEYVAAGAAAALASDEAATEALRHVLDALLEMRCIYEQVPAWMNEHGYVQQPS
jgi:hypothetical protein